MKKYLLISLGALLTACSANTDTTADVRWMWQTEEITTEDAAMPETQLTLVNEATGETRFQTTCDGIGSTETDIGKPDAIATVRCWWAGGGEDYVVVNNGGTLEVQTRTVDEISGFGAWETEASL